MHLSAGIDWISCTYPYEYPTRWKSCVHPADTDNYVEGKARNGYKNATNYSSGATLMVNHDRPEMGWHVTYTARAIHQLEVIAGVTQKQLLQHLSGDAKIARLDVRIDVADSGLIIEDLYKDAKAGHAETKSRSVGYQESAKTGNEIGAATCYVGSMKKRKKLLRVYDKAAQSAEFGDLKRFELELHSKSTSTPVKRLRSSNMGDWGKVIGGLIKGFCYWPQNPVVVAIFADLSAIKIGVVQEPVGDTKLWLLNVCAPALAKQSVLDSSLFAEFWQRVAEEIKQALV